MTTLTEFLTARLGEDEAVAVAADTHVQWNVEVVEQAAHIARHDPARALREVEAKREIVTRVHYRAGDGPRSEYLSEWQKEACEGCGWGGPCDDYHVEHLDDCPTLRALAAVYSDHPDYNPEWRL